MYGPVIIDLEGNRVTPQEHAILQHQNVGGVILFTKNYENIAQLKSLVKEIRAIAQHPLLIMVDHEGGSVWRFEEGFTHPPAAGTFGEQYDTDPELAAKQAHSAGKTIAEELIACGIDLTLAPILDLNTGRSNVIGNRAFHSAPQIVTALAKTFIAGLASVGMKAVGKHFPGHGYCSIDTHHAIGKDERSLEEISSADMLPFANLHACVQGIMPAHVIYPKVDSNPAGFSKIWLQEILRNKLQFEGAIISDCLSMKGSGENKTFATKALEALNAGCDLVILSQQTREVLLETLNSLQWQVSDSQDERIKGLAANFNKSYVKRPTLR